MSVANQFDWVDFYKELAKKLLEYKVKREKLVEKIKKVYDNTGLNLPKLDSDNQIHDIDPFTVFGLFNKSQMGTSRIKIINEFAKLFEIKSQAPTSFDGVPLLFPKSAMYYHYKEQRDKDDINNLWSLFESALAFDSNPSADNQEKVSKYFDLNVKIKHNGTSKITMGLFWIAPETFLSLDGTNINFVYKSGKIPFDLVKTLPVIKGKITFSQYFTIVKKLRNYLQSARSDLKDFKSLSEAAWRYANADNGGIDDGGISEVHYWTYSPGDKAVIWDECLNNGIMAIGWKDLGDLSQYQSKEEILQALQEKNDPNKKHTNSAHATWQFANEMKPGDIVFAKKGRRLVIGRGVVESDYYFDPNREDYKNVRKVKWTHEGEWEWQYRDSLALKTLTDVTDYTDYVDRLKALFDDVVDPDPEKVDYPSYEAEDFLKDVYIDKKDYEILKNLVLTKKNVILQGAPGVGKTYAAKRLAYSIMGVKDTSRVMMLQFHQSYSYEDFIMGFRPSEKGFELKCGAFYNFCKDAEIDSDNEYFLIIDEINRGNLSKIFGELFMLIEKDKREQKIQLLYSDEKFSIPKNVYIIGMMNTADRSLAMLDYALRRRFAFFEMKPSFDSKGFQNYQTSLASDKFNLLTNCVKELNEAIAADESLGEGFCIGHSYFCNLREATDQALSGIVEFELIPLLKEYWFDEPAKVRNWTDSLRNAIK